jgi:heptosyltransferase-2
LLRLRERFPQTQITLLAHEKLADLWEAHPGINSVVTFQEGESPWSIGRRLRGHGFDAALVFPNSPRSALEAWLAGIPHRVGYGGAPWRNWFLTQTVEHPPGQLRLRQRSVREIKRQILAGTSATVKRAPSQFVHQIHDYLLLAAALGAKPAPLPPRLEVGLRETESAMAGLLQQLRAKEPTRANQTTFWLGINTSAAYGPAKCWPLDRFAVVVREICKKVPNCVWLNFGSSTDWSQGEQLAGTGAASVLNLAGKTTLRELMAILRGCRVLLSNDSGPTHVAAALGTPVVVPFGSTSPELTAPGEPGDTRHHLLRGDAPCAPCFRRTCPIDFRCMKAITVEQVVAAILKSLSEIRA